MGNEQSNLLPKSSQARKKPPEVLIGRKERMQAQRCIILATALHSLANVQDNYKFSDREILSLGDLCIPIQSGAGRGEEGYKKRQTETATKPEKKEDRERERLQVHTQINICNKEHKTNSSLAALTEEEWEEWCPPLLWQYYNIQLTTFSYHLTQYLTSLY